MTSCPSEPRKRCIEHDKILFRNKRSARDAAQRMQDREQLCAYRCTAHKGWHVGHKIWSDRFRKPLKMIGVFD